MNETITEDIVWYLARDGKQHGPLSNPEMSKLVELGHLRPTDLVWRPGFADWRPVPTVFNDIVPQPAPAPAPAKTTARPAPELASQATTVPAHGEPTSSRPQPSFANMSAKVQPVVVEPAKPETAPFEFPGPRQPYATSGLGSSAPVSFQDEQAFDLSPDGVQGSQASPSLDPLRLDPLAADEPPVRKSRGLGAAVGLLTVIGALAAGGYVYRDTIKSMLQESSAANPAATLPVVEAPSEKSGSAASSPTAASPAPNPTAATTTNIAATPPAAVPPPTPVTAGPPDADLQASPFWSYAKTEFPQWYADRVREIGDMKAANQPADAIDRKQAEAIVQMRRQNASKALAASSDRLREIAQAFVANLGTLQGQSVDACYAFIDKAELSPAASAVVLKPAEGQALHTQLRAIFIAIVEGGKSPVTRSQPQQTDYNLLAAELGTIGWSQADIQLFADPKALSEAPRERVCKMVKDWFTAHLAVKDEPARERLLYETLRLVIAG